jgi:DNA mismatch repair protein MutH
MERQEAKRRISEIIGCNLRELADELEITVFKNGKLNKGWAGNTLERFLGLPLNSSQAPNFGSWEMKVLSMKYLKNGTLTVKETIAVTKIDGYNVVRTEFEDSHLLSKLRKLLIPVRIWESKSEQRSSLYAVTEFDLDNPEIYEQIKADYELARRTIREEGFDALTGRMGVIVQPRTKGTGHGSKTRAFYVRTSFLKEIILPTFETKNDYSQ